MQNFIKELSKYLENNITKNNKTTNDDFEFNDLHLGDLTLYGEKVIAKYRDEMIKERTEILEEYSENTKDKGEMYYIYAINSNDNNFYNLCVCNKQNNHDVITKSVDELPNGAILGSVLRKQNNEFILDTDGMKIVEEEINTMIKEKIEEQTEYLESKRVEGHIYEVGEKNFGRIWLYDLNNTVSGGIEGIEEIKFPEELYNDAQEGDKFIFQNGEYQKYV